MSDSQATSSSIYSAFNGNSYLFSGDYFDALQHVPAVDGSNAKDVPHLPVINAFAERAKAGGTRVVVASADAEMGRKRTAVQQLIAAYRNVGARWADLDPLKRTERENIPDLEHEPARDRPGAARDLLRHHWCGIHVQHRPGAKALVAAKTGKYSLQA